MLIVIIQPYINSLNLQAYHNKYHIESKVTSIFMIMFMCAYTHIHVRRSAICSPGMMVDHLEGTNTSANLLMASTSFLSPYYDKIFTAE